MNSFNLRNRFPFKLVIKEKNRVEFKEKIIKMSVCCVLQIENQDNKHCKDRYIFFTNT